ncbi:MAG TPA: phosphatase PAP2 family protein, partial [Anaerolineales bacterium]
MDSLYQFGIQLIQSIQTLSPALDGLMNIGSSIGLPEFFLVLIPFIYWNIDRRVGIRAMFVLLYFDFINASLKVLFHEPRPFWLGGVKQLSTEGSYGLPSGHSGRTLAVAGYLATQVRKNWFWAIAIIYILFVGISRMYLGMHFPQDVLGGWLLGILVIWAV